MIRDKNEKPHLVRDGKISSSQDIGHLIRLKRKEVGIKQGAAAGISGVGTKFLSQMKAGR